MRAVGCLIALVGCGRLNFESQPVDDAAVVDLPVDSSDPDLRLYFDFEAQTDDALGHPVRCLGGCPQLVPGLIGNAARFDTDDCLVIPDTADLRASAYSFTAWFNSQNDTSVQNIVGRTRDSETGSSNSWEMAYEVGDIAIYGGAGSQRTPVSRQVWHHVAGVVDGSTIVAYLDGVPFEQGPANLELVDGQAVRIGCDRDEAADVLFFQGDIDEVRVYTRALTDDEIAQLAVPP